MNNLRRATFLTRERLTGLNVDSVWEEMAMIGEGKPLQDIDGPGKLDRG
jgi:hypothetical protein